MDEQMANVGSEVVIDLGMESVNDEQEQQLKVQTSEIEVQAKGIIVNSDDTFKAAADFGKVIKRQTATIKEFFGPMKQLAYDTHKQICDREKAMLAPLVAAEKIVKQAMGSYQMQVEEAKRKAEEEARRLMREEADRKLAESLKSEANGDTAGAEAALAAADMLDRQSGNFTIESEAAKADGVSTSTAWEIESIDSSLVPIEIGGIELRPVSEKAIKEAIRVSKGKVVIPGVKYKEIKKISIRR